jgi:hypothetical protein
MRVCPKCGFIDPPEWKHVKWSYHIDSCSLDNFQRLHLELAEKLLKSDLTEDSLYVYRLSRSHKGKGIPIWVERKAKIDYDEKLYEKFPHFKSVKITKHGIDSVAHDFLKAWQKWTPKQTKILEVKQK